MAIEIKFLANVVNLLRGTKNMSEALDEVSDSLDDVARDAQQSAEKMEREYDSARKDVDDSAERLERSFKDLRDTAEKTARDGGKDLAREYKGGTDKAREGVRDFKDEAKANFSEVASSFDGSIEGVADGIQGTLGGAAGAIAGPAGVALGLLGAAAGASLTTVSENAELMKERTSEAFTEMAEEGIEAWASIESEQKRLREAYDQYEGDIKRIADLVGLPFETVASAWAGNTEAIEIVNRAYGDMKTELRDTLGVSVDAANATIEGWDRIKAPLDDTLKAYDDARLKAEKYTTQVKTQTAESEAAQREQIRETRAIDQARWEAAARRYGVTLQPAVVPVTADTSAADRAIRNFIQTPRRLRIDIEGRTANGQRVI